MISSCHLLKNVTSSKVHADCSSLCAQIAISSPLPFRIVRLGQSKRTPFALKIPFHWISNDMIANENLACNEDSLYNRAQSGDKSLLTSLPPVSAAWQYAICGVTAIWTNGNYHEKQFKCGGVWKFAKFHSRFLGKCSGSKGAEHLHAVVYHFDTSASSFSKSQIYIYSNVLSAVKVDTA